MTRLMNMKILTRVASQSRLRPLLLISERFFRLIKIYDHPIPSDKMQCSLLKTMYFMEGCEIWKTICIWGHVTLSHINVPYAIRKSSVDHPYVVRKSCVYITIATRSDRDIYGRFTLFYNTCSRVILCAVRFKMAERCEWPKLYLI